MTTDRLPKILLNYKPRGYRNKDSQMHLWGCAGKRSMEKKIQLSII
jgi:hypothetical protein